MRAIDIDPKGHNSYIPRLFAGMMQGIVSRKAVFDEESGV